MRLRRLSLALACLLSGTLAGCLSVVNLDPIDECPEGDTLCDDECLDLSTESLHCGECGRECIGETECIDSECARLCADGCFDTLELCIDDRCECRPDFESCDGQCVDISNDPDHCGGCFDACGPSSVCSQGECRFLECEDPGEVECGSACADLDWDPLHCGDCGDPCDADEMCFEGGCVPYEAETPCDECPCETCGDLLCCEGSDRLDEVFCIAAEFCPP